MTMRSASPGTKRAPNVERLERHREMIVELTEDEAEAVQAGKGKRGRSTRSSGRPFLRYQFSTVFTT